MIVVAIIGILAAIAIPAYQNYIAKSQVSSGLAEIAGTKTAYEVKVNEGTAITKLADIGLNSTSSTRCTSYSATTFSTTDGSATNAIVCELAGNPRIAGQFIALNRATDGQWACVTTLDSTDDEEKQFIPTGCTTLASTAKGAITS